MHTKKVLGIDPGDTTGYAIAEVVFDQGEWAFEIERQGEFTFPKGLKTMLVQMTSFEKLDTIVIEDYIIRQPHIGQSCHWHRK